MLTRCPACDTTFRITPEQLKARQGKVRCGECQHVFNALETLVEEASVLILPATEPVAQAAEALPESEGAVPPAPTFDTTEDEPLELAPEFSAEYLPETTADEPADEPLPDAPEDLPETPIATPVEPTVDALPEPSETEPPAPPPPPTWEPLLHEPEPQARRWPWAVGAGFALLALALQLIIHFRVELAVLSPESRPALETLCEIAGCVVDLPHKVELMTIETSDLQPVAEQKGALVLTATLRNRAPFAQAFPHLELTLTDADNKTLTRRILTAKDYLPAGTVRENAASGLPSGELAITLNIDSGELGASGYRLYLFYP